jgi:hypothetical protein
MSPAYGNELSYLGGKHIPGGVFSIVATVLLSNVRNSVKCFIPHARLADARDPAAGQGYEFVVPR